MASDRIDCRILGPLSAAIDGEPLALGPTKQRALLALLLLHQDRVVGREQIFVALWGEDLPETAGTALHGYVSGLRKVLGAKRIETHPPGYVLRGDGIDLDLVRFEDLVASARRLDVAVAAERLRSALELWRGEPLAGLDSAPFVDDERRRLEELRLGALEERIDADLTLGRHAALVGELEPLVREHPLRERLRGQLVLALYRSGRQAEALESYRQGRDLLRDELGLEPGEALRRLERLILEQDPALGEPDPLPGLVTQRRRRRRWIAAGALALLAMVAVAAWGVLGRDEKPVQVTPNSVAALDLSGRLVDAIPVGRRPVSVAAGAGGVWVANAEDETISRIDPETREVVATFGLGTEVSDLAIGFGSVWVADGNEGTVTRIDPSLNAIEETLSFDPADPLSPEPVFWVAAGAGAVWAVRGTRLLRIDPETSAVTSSLDVPPPAGLSAGAGAAWVVTQDHRLLRISPDGRQVTGDLELPSFATAPVAVPGAVWLIVYVSEQGEVWRIDPSSVTQEASGRTGTTPTDIAVARGEVWTVAVDATVDRLDAATLDVVSSTSVGMAAGTGVAVAVGEGGVWAAVASSR